VVRGVGRIDVNDGLIACVVDKPADAVGSHCTSCIDQALYRVRASDSRQIDVIRIVREIRNCIEISGTGL
jgi:NAD-specific glutamate dehydrogenase